MAPSKTSTRDASYITPNLPPPPPISKTTIPMHGLLIDIYGLTEAPPSTPLSILYLLHPRTRTRARMSDIASRVISAYNATSPTRGLIALAWDLPNHGSRLVSEKASLTWGEGNEMHALDMMGMVKGARVEMGLLMDCVEGYLGREVEGSWCLGWSLGGHAAWQGWVGEERLDGVVVVIGCPDFAGLMSDRAKLSDLSCGGKFIGSSYFPTSLTRDLQTHDPKSLLFPNTPLPFLPLSPSDRGRLQAVLEPRVKGKKLLLLSGAADELVPYKNAEKFVRLLEDLGVDVTDKVYEGVGHKFDAKMVEEAVRFLVEGVRGGPRKMDKARM